MDAAPLKYRANLTPEKTRFIAEHLRTNERNATAAYMHAFPNITDPNCACVMAHLLLHTDEDVIEEITRWKWFAGKGNRLGSEDFERAINRVALADAREITGYYIGPCRYCWGHENKYQRTPSEWSRDLKKHIEDRERKAKALDDPSQADPMGLQFDSQGGIGFNARLKANPACPECFGFGLGYPYFNDTRTLSDGAAALFDGLKQTKDGLEFKLRKRDASVSMLGNALGILRPKEEKTDPNAPRKIVIEGGIPNGPIPDGE